MIAVTGSGPVGIDLERVLNVPDALPPHNVEPRVQQERDAGHAMECGDQVVEVRVHTRLTD